jgi:hypothetical protein
MSHTNSPFSHKLKDNQFWGECNVHGRAVFNREGQRGGSCASCLYTRKQAEAYRQVDCAEAQRRRRLIEAHQHRHDELEY